MEKHTKNIIEPTLQKAQSGFGKSPRDHIFIDYTYWSWHGCRQTGKRGKKQTYTSNKGPLLKECSVYEVV